MGEPGRRARFREAAGATAQYGLLFAFAAVAAAISAQGLMGFARANMELAGPWPYLLWGALDGAAGLCAVLLMRRAARGESALAPRVAVWGLVASSSVFNWTHAPPHPGAREAFALMPVIAAVLFEFSLRETRHTARRAGRRLPGAGWLRPAERLRVQARLSADPELDAGAAAGQVRAEVAARRLHGLRLALAAQDRAGRPRAYLARRERWAERRARAALTRARFTDPQVAAEVLRGVQILALTPALARLDYTSPAGIQELAASLITTPGEALPATSDTPDPLTGPGPAGGWAAVNGHATRNGAHNGNGRNASGERALVQAAAQQVALLSEGGERLSQAALARRLRAEGFHIANERLRWLAQVSGLDAAAAQR